MAVDTVARALALASSSNSGDTAQIEESINTLQQNVSDMEASMTNNTNNLQSNINSLEREINTLEGDMDKEVAALRQYVDNKTVTAVNGSGVTNIVQLTQAQYDALTEKDGQTLYLILGE
jgi:tetrahydromethanopterin S-methyltransferase subunit B